MQTRGQGFVYSRESVFLSLWCSRFPASAFLIYMHEKPNKQLDSWLVSLELKHREGDTFLEWNVPKYTGCTLTNSLLVYFHRSTSSPWTLKFKTLTLLSFSLFLSTSLFLFLLKYWTPLYSAYTLPSKCFHPSSHYWLDCIIVKSCFLFKKR